MAGRVVSRGELAHVGESFGRDPVVLGAGVAEFGVYQALVDRQYGERVDLLVCLDQLGPGVVAVEGERVREVPGRMRILEGEQCEQDGVAGAGRGECGSDLVGVVVPTRAGGRAALSDWCPWLKSVACLAQSIARSISPISSNASAVSSSHAATFRSLAWVRMIASMSWSKTARR